MIKALSYKDISLVPRIPSYLLSRDEADTSVIALSQNWALPMIASPMPDVCNGEMANMLSQNNCLGIIHRFQSIESQTEEFNSCQENKYKVGCAIGVSGDYKERFQSLYLAGCRIFCIDTANGFHIQTKKTLMWISDLKIEDIKLIVGNVASGEGYHWLADCLLYNGFNDSAIRVGIAGGCFTSDMIIKTETGYKTIKDIELNEKVYTHTGELKSVLNKFIFKRNEKILKINNIECTRNHEFYVIKKEDKDIVNENNIHQYAIWISAEKLDKNKYFLLKMK